MLSPVIVTPPADTPVSVAECKAHCNVTHTEHDSLFQIYLGAAVAHLDGRAGILGRCMVTQTWRQDFHCWPWDGILRLPFCDVTSIESVKYSDEDDVEQTLSSSLYELQQDARSSYLRLRDAFTSPAHYDDRSDPVRVQFAAGYGAAAAVPFALKAAILLTVAHLYEHREAVVVGTGLFIRELPMGVAALIAPYRRVGV